MRIEGNAYEFPRNSNLAAILRHQKIPFPGITFWELLEIVWKKLFLTAPEFCQMVDLTLVNIEYFVAVAVDKNNVRRREGTLPPLDDRGSSVPP